ncbi:hypothetical protein Taro_008094 [Colocasia esculenta]|uniref:Uncharacterized protein n=1 Tax=Colocasia esculenta TaxID=4460 RepID=A0A843U2B5_COLES|nr:hypothetical protein [Colocasia esculenta]
MATSVPARHTSSGASCSEEVGIKRLLLQGYKVILLERYSISAFGSGQQISGHGGCCSDDPLWRPAFPLGTPEMGNFGPQKQYLKMPTLLASSTGRRIVCATVGRDQRRQLQFRDEYDPEPFWLSLIKDVICFGCIAYEQPEYIFFSIPYCFLFGAQEFQGIDNLFS